VQNENGLVSWGLMPRGKRGNEKRCHVTEIVLLRGKETCWRAATWAHIQGEKYHDQAATSKSM